MGPPKGSRMKKFVKSKMHGGTGGAGENTTLEEQIAALGLKVVPVTGDGNCFFRAVADQVEGNEEKHAKYRTMAVEYLEEHKEEFEPFLEEEITFDEYCNNMRQDGTWAGHMELQATSLVTKCDICIHRAHFPRWQILNFQSPGTPVLQLSFHGEEHYNSVRTIGDAGVGPPKLETIKVEENLVNGLPPAKDEEAEEVASNAGMKENAGDVKMVMAGTGCPDPIHVVQVLAEVHGDTDAAIEYIIAEGNASDSSDSSTDLISFGGSATSNEERFARSHGGEPGTRPSLLDSDIATTEPETGADSRSTVSRAKNAIMHPAQAVSRNKKCPCGSKKKYKVCCGAVHGKAGVSVLVSAHEGGSSNKLRKDRLKAARTSSPADSSGAFEGSTTSTESDLGVLCI